MPKKNVEPVGVPIHQPSKEEIERELARSGIVTQESQEREEEKAKTSIPILRTYKHDAAESIEEHGTSRIKMVAAEENKRALNKDFSKTFEFEEKESSIKTSLILIGVSLALIVSGVGGAIFFFNKSNVDTTAAIPVMRNVLFTNETVEADAKGITGNDVVNLVSATGKSANGRAGDLIEVMLLDNTLLGEQKISKNALFDKLETNAPSRLIRSFEHNYVVGVHVGDETTVFYLFKVEDFDTAFAGMLEWEGSMHGDLYGSIGGEKFVDEYLRNKDTRILRDRFENTKLVYAFPNSETLIITENEEAFFELFERLTVSNATQN